MRKKSIAIIIAVGIIAAGSVMAYGHLSAVEVDVDVVGEERVQEIISGTGHLVGDEEREVVARHSMAVDEIAVDAGDAVEAGALLARGDSEEYELEKHNLIVERDALRDEIESREDTLPSKSDSAQSRLIAARESLREAEENAAVMSDLFEAGATAEKDYRSAQLQVSAVQADVSEAEAALAEVRRQSRQLEAEARRLGSMDEQIASLRQRIAQHELTADRGMVVGEKLVSEGDVVSAGTPLFLLHTETMLVKIDVLAEDARQTEVGQLAMVSGDAVGDEEWEASVEKIHPRATERVSELGVRQRRVPLELRLVEMPDGAQPGYPVDVDIIVQEEEGLAVDRDAVFQLDGEDHVFLLRDDAAHLREVTVGLEGDELAIVLEGLSDGDLVVVNPPGELDDGIRVRLEE